MKEGNFYFTFLAVPAEVFLNPNLRDTDKFLFSLIKNMSTKHKECWASNAYFADILRVTKRTITSGLGTLTDGHYIHISMPGGKRKIFVDETYIKRYSHLVELFNRAYIDDDTSAREEYKNLC